MVREFSPIVTLLKPYLIYAPALPSG